MLKRSALAALVLASVASGAFAQTQSSQSYTPDRQVMPSPWLMRENLDTQATLWRESMTENPRPDVSQAEWRRARQAVVLIKANHCDDAYQLAVTGQDDRLAANIAQVCKATPRQ